MSARAGKQEGSAPLGCRHHPDTDLLPEETSSAGTPEPGQPWGVPSFLWDHLLRETGTPPLLGVRAGGPCPKAAPTQYPRAPATRDVMVQPGSWLNVP